MLSSVPVKNVFGALMVGFFLVVPLAQAGGSEPMPADQPAMSCQEMVVKAKSLEAKMPAGLDKIAAQKQIASAEMYLKRGAETACKRSIHDAAEAMTRSGK